MMTPRRNLRNISIIVGIIIVGFTVISYLGYRDPYFLSPTVKIYGDWYSDWEGSVFIPRDVKESWSMDPICDKFDMHLFPIPWKQPGTEYGATVFIEGKLSHKWYIGMTKHRRKKLKISKVISSKPLTTDTFEQRMREK